MAGTKFTEITEEQYSAANKRAAGTSRKEPRAAKARYDSRDKKVVVVFASGLELRFSPRMIQGLEGARVNDLRKIVISPSGHGIHFPTIDADVFLPALLSGKTGSRAWMAAQMGSIGGKSSSHAKATAARSNGKKGGRPRKQVPALA